MIAAALLAATLTVSGTVRDPSGAVVAGAIAIEQLAPSGEARQTVTGPDGRFTFPPTDEQVVLVVRAGGFAEFRQALEPAAASDATRDVDVNLTAATLLEAVTVTAARGPGGVEIPGATTVLSSTALDLLATPMLDDQLRFVPGFSLFRRSSSRIANPTTQGVTMRGLSASGASRSLILADGVPLNDPFGGWVYWDRIPHTALDRVEVVHGATGELYGADAVGGVIQALTFLPTRGTLRTTADYGSSDTSRVSLYGGGSRAGWSGFVSGEVQRSDGFYIVTPDVRGPVDTPASSDYQTAYASGSYQAQDWHAGIRANAFSEARQNGTTLTTNNTSLGQFAGDVGGTIGASAWTVRGYGGQQSYNQTFSSVNATRTVETLTQRQYVPSKNAGMNAQWTFLTGRATWTAGADVRRTQGESDERSFNASGIQTAYTNLGGVEWDTGAFAHFEYAALNAVTFDAALRVDRWSIEPNTATLPSRDDTKASPKVGVTWLARPSVAVHALFTQAFRPPTMNELYRSFRAGNTLTTANNALVPENLNGAEAGVDVNGTRGELRVIGFWNRLSDAVTNLTISTTPALITRQRTNAGTVRASGADVQAEWQIVPALRAVAGAEFVDSIFIEAQEPGLTGNRVPQVPLVQASAGLRANLPSSFTATAQIRYVSSQYDDDKNAFLLGTATIVDAMVTRSMGAGVQLFAAIENAFNDVYDVAKTPTRTVGMPRTFRVGVRAYLP